MARSIDVVQIPLGRETITLPWGSREALLGRFKHLDSMREMLRQFEGVGTSRPVQLTEEQKRALLAIIVNWAGEQGGYDRLPEGIYDLRHALLDDLVDTEAAAHKSGRRRVEPRVGHDSRKEEF